MLDKTIKIGLLFDFYGSLLTERQQESIRLYYFKDLSLGEIAERLEISRQGVYDHLHRGEELLRKYEDKLGLVFKEKAIIDKLDQLQDYIVNKFELEQREKQNLQQKIENIKDLL